MMISIDHQCVLINGVVWWLFIDVCAFLTAGSANRKNQNSKKVTSIIILIVKGQSFFIFCILYFLRD